MGALSSGITIFDEDDTDGIVDIAGRKTGLDVLHDLLDSRPAPALAPDRPTVDALSNSIFVATSNLREAAENPIRLPLTEDMLKRFSDVVTFKPLSEDTLKKIAAREAGKGLRNMGYDAEDSAAIAAAIAEQMMEGYAPDNGGRQLKGKFKAIAGAPGFKDTYFPLTKAGKAAAKHKIRAAVVQAFRDGPGDVTAPPRAVFKKKNHARAR